MKSTVKDLSDTKIEMTISLDAEELAIAQQVAVAKLSREVKVPGFRKGKAPADIAIKNINPTTLQEQVLDNAISKNIAEAFVKGQIQALDRPSVAVKKYVPGESLEFVAEVEIMPKVILGDYKKLKTQPEKVAVVASEVDDTIQRIQSGLAKHKEVGRAVKMGDEVVIDFVGKKDGAAFNGGTGNDHHLVLGSKQFIPGFEEGVVGHKTGETFDINLTFPKDYQSAELKGQNAVFTTTIKSVNELILPELDDKLAVKAGPFKTMTELKNDIKKQLITQKQREAVEKLKENLVRELVSISKVPVPEILVADQSASIERDFVNNLMYQGITLEQYIENKGYKSKDDWKATELKEAAVNRVKAGLVLAELSKVEKIDATTAELDAHVDLYKKQYANNPEALKQFESPEVRQDIASRLLTEKTVDRLVELNTKK